ncbi:MAG: tyrosine--tRNA ligase, partial [Mycobacterium sp.]
MSAEILDELDWRGLIAQSTDLDALAAETRRRPTTVYAGFDPTAPSLHAGHLVPLLALRRFQRAGHRPIVLAGGATGMIGDPRDIGERTLNEADTVAEWTQRIRGQLERFVDFDGSPTGAIIENNLEWTQAMSTIEFLREVGKHFSVNVMLDRDTVRRRLEGDGISYTEFSYMLLQANDYVELHRRHGCALQIGGSDQWGNIIAGVRLVRQKLGASVHALTVPLVTAADGTKFGKSTGGGSLWLDPQMTSPYAWYQYFVNTADADVIRYLRWFTFLSADELAELERATQERPQQRAAQRRLATELTVLVHGEAATEAVEHASRALFGQGDLDRLDEATLAAALREASVAELKAGAPDGIVDLLVASGLSASKGAARRTIGEGGVSVNNVRIDSDEWAPQA